jgi:predicted O-linked N-acetylglucosamine transferase (SPINDLY family)
MYRKMGLTQCVAKDADNYVRIALSIGTDEERRRHVRKQILERNDVLFEDMRAVYEFERFFRESCSRI